MPLRVKWTEQTAAKFGPQGFNIPWTDEVLPIKAPSLPMTIDDVAKWIEARIEGVYFQMKKGQSEAQAQVMTIRKEGADAGDSLPWDHNVERYLKEGDTVICDVALASDEARGQPVSEAQLEIIRKTLRFGQNDRVLCYCGPRWFSGWIVGTAALDEDNDIMAYLVKTDPVTGLPSRTVSVPSDRDELCVQEVCFDPITQLHLVRTSAQEVKESAKPTLRFAVAEAVVVRVRSDTSNGLERWVAGTVEELWPTLGATPDKFDIAGVIGEFPNIVPYKVKLAAGGWVYCTRDNFTLIRREHMKPKVLVKGLSKRMEVAQADDGNWEKIDHQTEKRRKVPPPDSDDED